MPYITTSQRDALDPALTDLIKAFDQARTRGEIPASAVDGALNYIITRLLHAAYAVKTDPHYQDFNAAVGVLESVKLELYRRYVAPYENGKMADNGDV
jgi:hypothetical protein